MSKNIYPLLPLRDLVIFPEQHESLFVGRTRSIAAIAAAKENDGLLVLSAQRNKNQEEPNADDIYAVGVLARIEDVTRLPDDNVKLRIAGLHRVAIHKFTETQPTFMVEASKLEIPDAESVEARALVRSVHKTFESYTTLARRPKPDIAVTISAIDEPNRLSDAIAPWLPSKLEKRQNILEVIDPIQRLESLLELLQREVEVLLVERKIRNRVKKQLERGHKEGQDSGGSPKEAASDRDEFRSELQELEEAVHNKDMPEEGKKRCLKELKKLKQMSPISAEATVLRNYVDWVLALPWNFTTKDKLDIQECQRILDGDHYGLKKVKERIIEYLAVQELVQEIRGPILCFVGPPGVGKTSLARSIAKSMDREFVRISLGGVRDEAEIRGHRRTYIGALPGKILQGLKKAGSNNPVFLLDEVDKMSMDFRGDPSAALLEVLDPEQNNTFGDHYVDLDYDLSKVLFVCTANNQGAIPLPLQDRMEIIQLTSYTREEKIEIAKNFLLPKQMEINGLKDVSVSFRGAALKSLVDHYTREAGVRSLERTVGAIYRKIARKVVESGKDQKFVVTPKLVSKFLGPHRYRLGQAEAKPEIGLAHGLAVTFSGGELLKAEVSLMPGKGKLIITGKLGEVMQESAQAAMSYVRSRARMLGLSRDFYQNIDIHVHFPEGAIPKDGPSAGITMATALVSALTQIPVRSDVAMTGEITLRGSVLPIGGLKEKSLAALRAGVKTVIFPEDNVKDLEDVPNTVRRGLTMANVSHMDDVLKLALDLEDPDTLFKDVSDDEDYLRIREEDSPHTIQ
jgi:ATP-dependent Lon protease